MNRKGLRWVAGCSLLAGVICLGAAINGFLDMPKMSAPANPASGYNRLYMDSGTGLLTCRNSAGGNCSPSASLTPPVTISGVVAGPVLTVTNTSGSFVPDIKTGGAMSVFGGGSASYALQIDRASTGNSSQVQFTVAGSNVTTGSWNVGPDVSNEMSFIYGPSALNLFSVNTSGNIVSPGSADLGSTLSATGKMFLTGAASTHRTLEWETSRVLRWSMDANNAAESGGAAGSDFLLTSYDDTGAFLSNVLSITRSTGIATWANGVVFSSTATLNGTVNGTHGQNVGTGDSPSFAALTIPNTTTSNIHVGASGNLYTRPISGLVGAISCSGVDDGWFSVLNDSGTYWVVACSNSGQRLRAALATY